MLFTEINAAAAAAAAAQARHRPQDGRKSVRSSGVFTT